MGKQKMSNVNNQKSKGKLRYLPSKAWDHLSPEQIKRTNNEKLRGYKRGKQFVSNPKDVANIAKNFRSPYRKSPKKRSPKKRSPKKRSPKKRSPKTRSPKTRSSPKTSFRRR